MALVFLGLPFSSLVSLNYSKISRQQKDFCVKAARKLCQSSDLVAFEDLRVKNMVKNRKLSKSISDASWSLFKQWIINYGKLFGIATIAVALTILQ